MGEDQLKTKIKAQMDQGITSESQVVYLLVEIRKLMDRDRTGTQPYSSLRLYSDWAVHIVLYGPQAQDIVKSADAFYPKLMNGSATQQEKADLAKIFSLGKFREEIDRFLNDHVQRKFSDPAWNSFLKCFLGVIEDCPLICKAENAALANVDEVVIVGGADDGDGAEPAIAWGLYFKGDLKFPMGKNIRPSQKLVDTLVAYSESRKAKATTP